ncbi:unnamed protein product, partial [Rotaria socialis]
AEGGASIRGDTLAGSTSKFGFIESDEDVVTTEASAQGGATLKFGSSGSGEKEVPTRARADGGATRGVATLVAAVAKFGTSGSVEMGVLPKAGTQSGDATESATVKLDENGTVTRDASVVATGQQPQSTKLGCRWVWGCG